MTRNHSEQTTAARLAEGSTHHDEHHAAARGARSPPAPVFSSDISYRLSDSTMTSGAEDSVMISAGLEPGAERFFGQHFLSARQAA